MSRKFLTERKVLDFLVDFGWQWRQWFSCHSQWISEILLPDPVAPSDTKTNDDSSTMKIKETMWDEVRPKEVAGMIDILVSSSNEEDYVNPQ